MHDNRRLPNARVQQHKQQQSVASKVPSQQRQDTGRTHWWFTQEDPTSHANAQLCTHLDEHRLLLPRLARHVALVAILGQHVQHDVIHV